MRVRILDNATAREDLAETWDSLLQAADAPSPFLCWTWIRTWWATYGRAFREQVAVVETDGRVVGVAPLMLGRVGRGPARWLRRILFIGQEADTRAEALDLLVEAGSEARVAGALATALRGTLGTRWDALLLESVPQASPRLSALLSALREAGVPVATCAPTASPCLALPATWEGFLAGRSRNFARQLRNAENRAARRGSVRVRRVGEDLDPAEGLDVLAALHRKRWDERSGSFRSADYLSFHRTLAARLHEQGRLYLAVMEIDGRPAAARYDYLWGDRIWCMQGGWDPEFGDCRPGTIMTADVVRWGIEHGFRVYEFLAGEQEYKRRWADSERTFVDVVAANPSTLRGRLYARRPCLRGEAP